MTEGSTGIIFRNGQNEVLLVQRLDNGVWVLPGGGIDSGESAEMAVVREILEETGLNVRVKRKVGEYNPINRLCSFAHVFECEVVDGILCKTDETRGAEFFPLSQLPAAFFPLHNDWIEDARLNSEEVLKKPIARLTYFEVAKYLVMHPLLVLAFFWTRIKMRFSASA